MSFSGSLRRDVASARVPSAKVTLIVVGAVDDVERGEDLGRVDDHDARALAVVACARRRRRPRDLDQDERRPDRRVDDLAAGRRRGLDSSAEAIASRTSPRVSGAVRGWRDDQASTPTSISPAPRMTGAARRMARRPRVPAHPEPRPGHPAASARVLARAARRAGRSRGRGLERGGAGEAGGRRAAIGVRGACVRRLRAT